MASSPLSRSAVVTGATAGIGKELVRQLARRGDFTHIYLAARNPQKLTAVAAELEAATGHGGLVPLTVDVTDTASVHRAIAELPGPIDALVTNAGGIGASPLEITDSGMTRIAALNVLGHVVLASELMAASNLTEVVVNAGTEGSRGVPLFGIPKPRFADTVDGITAVLDGSYYQDHKYTPTIAYGDAKYVGVLAMAALARRYRHLRIVNVSPGATSGTDGVNDLSGVERFILGKVAPAVGLAHGVDTGAGRYLTVLDDPSYRSGGFYASAANRLTGKLVDQARIFPESANETFQENALEAVSRFVPIRR